MNDLHEWFQKNDLCPENILYLYRNDRKTVVHRMDGEEVALYAPLHSVLSALPEDMFLNISKGIVVCRSQIVDISNDGIYTMSDGRSFQGRRRGLSDHRRLRAEIRRVDAQPRPMSMSLLEKCSLLDDMLGRSFYGVFPNGDKKWLVSYADVALNGTKHILHDYSPEVDKCLTIHCYQPEPGYCACVLQATDP